MVKLTIWKVQVEGQKCCSRKSNTLAKQSAALARWNVASSSPQESSTQQQEGVKGFLQKQRIHTLLIEIN